MITGDITFLQDFEWLNFCHQKVICRVTAHGKNIFKFIFSLKRHNSRYNYLRKFLKKIKNKNSKVALFASKFHSQVGNKILNRLGTFLTKGYNSSYNLLCCEWRIVNYAGLIFAVRCSITEKRRSEYLKCADYIPAMSSI